MARLSLKDIEARVEPLGGRENYDREIIFELLDAYGKPKSSITRLRNGSINIAEDPTREIGQKNVVYFRELTPGDEPFKAISELSQSAHVRRFSPRFIIVTDYSEFVALDTKTNENRVFPIRELPDHFTFFLPWAGMEKAQYVAESHADVKAAERMGKLFDELLSSNPDLFDKESDRHGLNVFFTRLLFCYFAEDTGIFGDGQFTNAVASHTHDDGSDVQEFLTDLFAALDEENSESKPSYLADFPYVNGRLFSAETDLVVPEFSRIARTQLIELGALMWQDINPDIFGSMFQVIVKPGKRSDLGQHYTSVPNILKTIEPLFLDELKEEFDKAFDSVAKLEKLHDRIAEIKVFDPACGSGNFLVIAYKELRKLEHAIMDRILELSNNLVLFDESRINIEHFYGIEIDDFAGETAILSLWISKHQMNVEFEEKFKTSLSIIPLRETGQIRVGNAARIPWESVCPNNGTEEIYIIGNPPYGGSKKQKEEQKEDFEFVFVDEKYSKNLDYIALWFIKGSRYIQGTRAELALVSTNSVAQGEHVGLMFPKIFALGVEISFAYTSFKWENNAKHNAGVTVVVIGLRNESDRPKYIFQDDLSTEATNINGYLADGPNVFIYRRTGRPLNDSLPKMRFGNMPMDGGNLLLSPQEKDEILGEYPKVRSLIKKIVGSKEFIGGIDRYCIWITADKKDEAYAIESIRHRIEAVKASRLSSSDAGTRKQASRPWSFREQYESSTDSIIVPSVSSENRDYIPIGYLDSDTVISNLAFAVYDAEPWLFALLTSRIHMVWTRAVGGKMKTDYRYSNTIVYNNFPVPPLKDADKEALTQVALRVLDVREYFSERTLAQLYDREKMPTMLKEAHLNVDKLVDSLYSKRPFESDEARLSHLFDMYKEQTSQSAPTRKAKNNG